MPPNEDRRLPSRNEGSSCCQLARSIGGTRWRLHSSPEISADPYYLMLVRHQPGVRLSSVLHLRGGIGNGRGIKRRYRRCHREAALGRMSRAPHELFAVRNCTRDQGGPFEFGDQEPISSHRKLLRAKPWWCCVKKARERHAVREMKADYSEPSCRGGLQTAMSCFSQKLR